MTHLFMVEGLCVPVTLGAVLLGAVAPCMVFEGKLVQSRGPDKEGFLEPNESAKTV